MTPPDERDIYAKAPVSWIAVSLILTVAGAAAFLYGASGRYALRAWQVFTVNYVFWAGLAFGAVLFSAVLNLSKAVWGRPIKRLAEAFSAYLPVSFLLFWGFLAGKETVFPWIARPVPEKQAFLNAPFMFAREGVCLLALTVLSLLFVYYSVKADREWLRNGRPRVRTEYPWSGLFRAQWRLSPVLPAAYAFILSLLAIDLIMSLSSEWYSTLFPGYYFIASFYSAVAAIYLFALAAKNRLGIDRYLFPRQFHDLGKLTFGFAIFTGYLFYAQLLVIWYGNLPEETRFVILRTKLDPWKGWAWAVLFMCLPHPFLYLAQQKNQDKARPHDRADLHDTGRLVDGAVPPRRAVALGAPAGHSFRHPRNPRLRRVFRPGLALRHGVFVAFPGAPRIGPVVPQVPHRERREHEAVKSEREAKGISELRLSGKLWLMRKKEEAAGAAMKSGRVWLLVGGLLFAFLFFFYGAYPALRVGPEQPIPFSHRVHAGVKEINCRFCHSVRGTFPGRGDAVGRKVFFLSRLRDTHAS